jgi:tetratricopeptide (TPR) repeat protein
MKKSILIVVSVFFLSSANAQDAFKVQMDVYKSALKYYDLQTAVSALYNAMAIKPDRTDLKDSLTLIYFAGERYAQSNALAEEILKVNPKRPDMLEVAAVSKVSLGAIKEGLTDYENLYKEKKEVYYLYQIATLQYQLKRYGEAVVSIDQIIADSRSAEQTVTIRSQNGQAQEVPLKAAAYNVKGIVAMDLNQDDAAKLNFDEAIKNFPDFLLAKGNLKTIEEKKSKPAAAKPTTQTPAAKAPAK